MEISQLNACLREMFVKLIGDGFTKSSITEVTLGKSFNPQFTKFIDDTDLGIKPLTRMIESLGYDLHIVPIKPTDTVFNKIVEKQMNVFYKETNSDLMDYLDNKEGGIKIRTISDKFIPFIDQFMDEIERGD